MDLRSKFTHTGVTIIAARLGQRKVEAERRAEARHLLGAKLVNLNRKANDEIPS